MNTVYLSLGSNLGEREQNIEAAYSAIQQRIGKILLKSEHYENEAEGFESTDPFLNTCIKLTSNLKPQEILKEILLIEKEIGRQKKTTDGTYESRLIDIDIIFYNDAVISESALTIPHIEFRNRIFVLKPLIEIANNTVDPISQLTTKQLLSLL